MKKYTFGRAIEFMKQGKKIAREGWNGKGMYITLIPAGNAMQPGWLASQSDMLAEDWTVVE